MCSQTCTAVFFLIVFRIGSFVGDGLMLYSLINENLRFPATIPSSRSFGSSKYCNSTTTDFESLRTDIAEDLLFSLISYAAVAVFALLITPALVRLAVPSSTDEYADINNEDDGDTSIDFLFRTKEKGGKRALRYLSVTLLVFVHDIPTLALGSYAFASTVAPDGPRCITCLYLDGNVCQLTDYHRGWTSDTVFPRNNDYFLLILLGGKVLGTIACIATVIYFELQYRFHINELAWHRQSQLLRIHFGQRRSEEGRWLKFWGIWFLALLGTVAIQTLAVLMMLAPTVTVLWFRMNFGFVPFAVDHLKITTFVAWGAWGIGLLGLIATTCGFAFCRRCFVTDD